MSNPKYKMIGSPSDKVIEECSELIKEICKAKRFGLMNFHPSDPKRTNLQRILSEMKDVEDAIVEYRKNLESETDVF